MHGKLYVVGGLTDDSAGQTNSMVVYDPVTKVWTESAPMGTARIGPGVAAMEGHLYVLGGADSNGVALGTAEAFNPDANPGDEPWMRLPDLPTRRGAPGVAVIGNKIWVVGGCNDQGIALNCVEVLMRSKQQVVRVDSEIEMVDEVRWLDAPPMPTPRAGLGCCAVVGDRYNAIVAVAGCGTGHGDQQFLDVVEWLDVDQGCWHEAPRLISGRRYPAVCIGLADENHHVQPGVATPE